MKNTSWKVCLASLLLMASYGASGQQTPPGPIAPLGPQETTVTTGNTKIRGAHFDPAITDFSNELTNAILFFNPLVDNGFTLRASAIEDHASRALEFTTYNWYYDGDGTTLSTTPIADEHNVMLSRTALAPGYHYYRVEGFIIPPGSDPDVICPPDASETFVVFVLPPLSVTVAHTDGITGLLQYCEVNAASQSNVKLTANVEYESYTETPNLEDFELKYTWYAVKSSDAGDVFSTTTFPNIDDTKADITGALYQEDVSVVATTQEFTPTIGDIGTYKFFVEVEYTLKSRHIGLTEPEDLENRNRPYVIYRGWFGGNQTDAEIVYVTPQPGKPHITIESVND